MFKHNSNMFLDIKWLAHQNMKWSGKTSIEVFPQNFDRVASFGIGILERGFEKRYFRKYENYHTRCIIYIYFNRIYCHIFEGETLSLTP